MTRGRKRALSGAARRGARGGAGFAAVVVGVAGFLAAGCGAEGPDEGLLLYCGAGLRPAVTEVVEAYRRATGTVVTCDYGGGGMILSRLRLSRRGDLFMPGDVWYVELAEKEGLIASKTMVCYFVPVILVPRGNPAKVTGLADLARPGVRVGLGDPKSCQVGRLVLKMFEKNGIDPEAVRRNTVYTSATVNELGVQIKAGRLDATIVWDAVAALYPEAGEVVPIPPEQNIISRVAVALLKASERPEEARRFIEFLVGEQGQAIFRKHHYRTEPPE